MSRSFRKMPSRRSRLEIILAVLLSVRSGEEKPTKIMYAANLSWGPTQRMLSYLVERGLLIVREEGDGRHAKRRYRITERGLGILDYFERAQEIISPDVISL
jgi:predicted transcriptional regulator